MSQWKAGLECQILLYSLGNQYHFIREKFISMNINTFFFCSVLTDLQVPVKVDAGGEEAK